jgi:hypothetical protein
VSDIVYTGAVTALVDEHGWLDIVLMITDEAEA